MSLDNILWSIRPRSGKVKLVDPASFAAMESARIFFILPNFQENH